MGHHRRYSSRIRGRCHLLPSCAPTTTLAHAPPLSPQLVHAEWRPWSSPRAHSAIECRVAKTARAANGRRRLPRQNAIIALSSPDDVDVGGRQPAAWHPMNWSRSTCATVRAYWPRATTEHRESFDTRAPSTERTSWSTQSPSCALGIDPTRHARPIDRDDQHRAHGRQRGQVRCRCGSAIPVQLSTANPSGSP